MKCGVAMPFKSDAIAPAALARRAEKTLPRRDRWADIIRRV